MDMHGAYLGKIFASDSRFMSCDFILVHQDIMSHIQLRIEVSRIDTLQLPSNMRVKSNILTAMFGSLSRGKRRTLKAKKWQ